LAIRVERGGEHADEVGAVVLDGGRDVPPGGPLDGDAADADVGGGVERVARHDDEEGRVVEQRGGRGEHERAGGEQDPCPAAHAAAGWGGGDDDRRWLDEGGDEDV